MNDLLCAHRGMERLEKKITAVLPHGLKLQPWISQAERATSP